MTYKQALLKTSKRYLRADHAALLAKHGGRASHICAELCRLRDVEAAMGLKPSDLSAVNTAVLFEAEVFHCEHVEDGKQIEYVVRGDEALGIIPVRPDSEDPEYSNLAGREYFILVSCFLSDADEYDCTVGEQLQTVFNFLWTEDLFTVLPIEAVEDLVAK